MNAKKVILPNALMLGEVSRMLDDGHSVVIMTKGASMSPFIRGERDSVELEKRPTKCWCERKAGSKWATSCSAP